MEKLRYAINLVIVCLMLLTIAVNRDGKVLGTSVQQLVAWESSNKQEPIETLSEDGTRVINSASIAKDIAGFGGPTPLKMYLRGDTISRIELLENNETPDFLAVAIEKGVLTQWIGISSQEAAVKEVDAVSGATLTSTALNQTVMRAAAFAAQATPATTIPNSLSLKNIIGLLVIGLGVTFTFVKIKSKHLRTLHLLLNVMVLGVWCGSFLSLSLLINWLSNGVHLSAALLPFILLLTAIITPFFGKKANYCTFHCPMGSLQELLGKTRKSKINLSQKLVNRLGILRECILLALLFIMWVGVGFELMDYEVFSLFVPNSASLIVLLAGGVFLILSPFINRPYCRFICPTGSVLKFYQQSQKETCK